MNPKYYDKMSELLDALIEERRQEALDYKDYLEKLIEHAEQARQGRVGHRLPGLGRQRRPARARRLLRRRRASWPSRSTTIVRHTKPDSLGRQPDEGEARSGAPSRKALPGGLRPTLDELFELVKARHEYR